MKAIRTIGAAFALAATTLLLAACGNQSTQRTEPGPAPEKKSVQAATFDADSAYAFVKAQVKFGPRVPNTAAHAACAKYLEAQLRRFTPQVVRQSFDAKAYDGSTLQLTNLIARFNPDASSRILLCAHWDSRPYADNDPDTANHRHAIPGANDGASGVGILLEIARELYKKAPSTGVDILLLDGEDYGAPYWANYQGQDDWALGAQYWAHHPHQAGYKADMGILLDMVGGAGARFTQEGTSLYYAPDVMRMVWETGTALGYSSYFSPDETQALTDDHLYLNQIARIPTIDIIEHDPGTHSGFYKYWHTLRDDMAGIAPETLMAVGQTVLTVVYGR